MICHMEELDKYIALFLFMRVSSQTVQSKEMVFINGTLSNIMLENSIKTSWTDMEN
jgi:hypothetical protein